MSDGYRPASPTAPSSWVVAPYRLRSLRAPPTAVVARRFLPRHVPPCHGMDGLGQRGATGAGYQFPPLWGPDSFNNGAGMSRLLTAAAYAMHNMPIGTTFSAPVLTEEEAYDVAAYIVGQKRPEMASLDKDFPVQLQKPIDTPYGPYADQFSPEQHKFGPFEPICAKVRELAAQSRTEKAGEPDNGSAEPDRAR